MGGFLVVGGLLLVGYLKVIGVAALRVALASVPPRRFISLLLVGSAPIVLWGIGLHLILDRFGRAHGFLRSVLLFDAASFLNTVTPFGQLGGDPPAALLFTRALDTDFETGLAAIGTTNAVNNLASLFLGLAGVSYLGSQVAVGPTLVMGAVAVVGVSVAALLGAGLAWRVRGALVRHGSRWLARAARPLDRLPRVTPPSRAQLQQRGTRFVTAIEVLGTAPRRLALVFGAAVAGHLAVAATMWVALAALGTRPSFALVVVIIPATKLSGLTPTPGGLGSAEALLTTLLVATTGATAAVAGAAAVLYRTGAFWMPSLGGAVVTAWYGTQASRLSADQVRGPKSAAASPGTEPVGFEAGERESPVAAVLIALAVTLVILAVVVVHRQELLIEPESPVVHLTRDGALVILSFGIVWGIVRRIPEGWLH